MAGARQVITTTARQFLHRLRPTSALKQDLKLQAARQQLRRRLQHEAKNPDDRMLDSQFDRYLYAILDMSPSRQRTLGPLNRRDESQARTTMSTVLTAIKFRNKIEERQVKEKMNNPHFMPPYRPEIVEINV